MLIFLNVVVWYVILTFHINTTFLLCRYLINAESPTSFSPNEYFISLNHVLIFLNVVVWYVIQTFHINTTFPLCWYLWNTKSPTSFSPDEYFISLNHVLIFHKFEKTSLDIRGRVKSPLKNDYTFFFSFKAGKHRPSPPPPTTREESKKSNKLGSEAKL